MASRTQLRLGQITGSFGDRDGGIVDNLPVAATLAAIPAGSGSMVSVMSQMASAIQRIHGGAAFTAQAEGVFAGRIQVDDTTNATSTTDGSLQTDGGLSVALDAVVGDDLFLKSDSAVLNFGEDSDVSLTHAADTGLLLNSSRQLQFGDADTYVNQASDGVLQLRSDTTVKAVIGSTDAVTINSTGATFGQNVTITGNLDVNGTTTTIDTQNLTVEDSIIGLGVSGSDGTWSNVGDRGIVFAKGAANALLPAFYYSGDDSIFQLGLSATSAASGTFVDPAQGNHSTLRLGRAEFGAATDFIGIDAGTGNLTIKSAGALVLSSSSDDIVFKDGNQELLTLDSAFGHQLIGELRINGQNGTTPGALVLRDQDDSNQVTLKAPATVSSNYELLFPGAIGSGNQVLRLNSGATALEFADVSAAGNTKKQVLVIDAGIPAGTDISIDSGETGVSYIGDSIDDLSTAGSQGKVLDVFVNGQLLVSGSSAQRTAGSRDYEVASATELAFAFDLEVEDLVQIIKRG